MAKINKSDATGRALEYVIVKEILKSSINVKCDNKTLDAQSRDKAKYETLSENLKTKYIKSAKKILEWLKGSYGIKDSDTIIIRRISDDEAKKGNVTDIEVNFISNKINFSIKHNHSALKHQRPSALTQQCGFPKKSIEDKSYREYYKSICFNFVVAARKLISNAKLFDELKLAEESFIDDNLYYPTCALVCGKINLWGKNPFNTTSFFSFIVGMTNYYKIIVRENSIEILKFNDVALPTQMTATLKDKSYVLVKFNNSWEISMRIHTASSRIIGVSQKFDTQPVKMDVQKEILKF